MRESFTFYCDESGNSGANYIDPSQPFYVVGGFLLPDDRLVDVAVALEELRKQHCPQAQELKAATILRRPAGTACVDDMIGRLGKLGAWPLFVVAEKRFCVAAKIVETFLDPPFNDVLHNAFIADLAAKRQIANDLHRLLSAESLNTFARAYRRPDAENLRVALDMVIAEARTALSPEIARLLEGARSHLGEIAETEGWQGGDLDGINLPSLLSLFQMIETIGRTDVLRISKFVHDETASHEEAYHKTFLTYRGLGKEVIRLPNGAPIVSGLHAISKFEMQTSRHSPFIQAADLFAGALNRACRRLDGGVVLQEEERKLNSLLFTPLMMKTPPVLAWPVVSNAFLAKLVTGLEWTKQTPSDGPLATPDTLLPTVGAGRPRTPPGPRSSFPCPTWVLVEPDGRLLAVQRRDSPDSDKGDPFAVVPVFSNESAAAEFKQVHYPGDDLRAEGLGDDRVTFGKLVAKLEAAATHAKYVVLDCNQPGPWRLTPIDECVLKLRAVAERAVRAVASGVADVLRQEHVVEGRSYVTLLLSSGEYAAHETNPRNFVTAETREAALALAVEQTRAGLPPT